MSYYNEQANYHGLESQSYHRRKKHPDNFDRHSSAASSRSNSRRDIFPCKNPCTPNLSEYQDRLDTFYNWPRNILRSSPEEIATAGFSYLGERDRVKCFYCNGGLQNWEYDEDPWFEHAKWYPNCEYLLRETGLEYVEKVASKFPGLQRPMLRNQELNNIQQTAYTSSIPSPTSQGRDSTNLQYLSSSSGYSSSSTLPPLQGDPLEKEMSGEIVTEVLNIGFERDVVRKLIRRKLDQEGGKYSTVQSLVEDLLTEEESMEISSPTTSHAESPILASSSQPSSCSSFSSSTFSNACVAMRESSPREVVLASNHRHTSHHNGPIMTKVVPKKISQTKTTIFQNVISSTSTAAHSSVQRTEDVGEKLREIRDEQTCKVCLDRKIDCLLRPCNHLCCCVECSGALRTCPLCRKKIEFIMKIYR